MRRVRNRLPRIAAAAGTIAAALVLTASAPWAPADVTGEPLVTVGVEVTAGNIDAADYSITVFNRGTAAAEGVTVSADVPANTRFASSSPGPDASTPSCVAGAAAGTVCAWQLPAIAAGASRTITARYELIRPVTGSFSSPVSLTASVQANGAPNDSDTDSSLLVVGDVPQNDAFVDDNAPANTNHGACAELRVSAGNAVTSFLRSSNASVSRPYDSLPAGNPDGPERVLAAELRAVATSTPAAPTPTISAHRVTSGSWTEGAGGCSGAPGANRDARTGKAPFSNDSATATAEITGVGAVRWDVTSALDTEQERVSFRGFELREASSLPLAAVTFGSAEAPPVEQPRLDVVLVSYERGRCIEAAPEQGAAPSSTTQRVDAYVTDSSDKVSGAETVACSGSPRAGTALHWDVEDDDPDAYVASVNGRALAKESGTDAGPDRAAARTDSEGHASMTLALDEPFAAGSNSGDNRVGAWSGFNAADPEDPSGCTGCPPPSGEATNEDDVIRTWTPATGTPGIGRGHPSAPRVYMITVDGLNPAEVGPTLTPNISALRSQGTWWEQARAVFPAETLPNHVSMSTGVLPQDHGIVANKYWQPNWSAAQRADMSQPELLEADTLTTRLERSCDGTGGISTATVMSKTYLYDIFRGEAADPDDTSRQREADYHPRFPAYIPLSDHIVDSVTMDAFRTWVSEQSSDVPQVGWLNMGDVDRSGHVDEGAALAGGALTSIRQAAIEEADAQIGMLVDDLQQSGAWEDTVLIINSDHRMDWGTQNKELNLQTILTNAGFDSSDFQTVGNGGTGGAYVLQPEDIEPMARAIAAAPGIDFVATPDPVPGLDNPTRAELGIEDPRSPQITAFVKPTYHFNEGDANYLPGNHGHPFTQPSVLLVAGGHPMLDDTPESVAGETVYDPGQRLFAPPAGGPGNLSPAPTIAGLLGIGEPAGGYARPPLREAFKDYAFLPHSPCEGTAPPADLSIQETDDPDPVRVGENLTYTVTVTNSGPNDAGAVQLTDTLPEGVRFASAVASQGTCAHSAATVSCSLGSVLNGGSASVDIEVTPETSGTITNRVVVDSVAGDPVSGNNTATESTVVNPTLGYARPRSATPQRIALVPAYEACREPSNASHGAPLAVPSCSPPVQSSDYLTIGSPDANGNPAIGAGALNLKVVGESPVDPGNGDQADVQISASFNDVRNKSDLSDYAGELRAVIGLRITDRYNGSALQNAATVTDTPLAFNFSCSVTAGSDGARCNVATTADAVTTDIAGEGKRAIWELGQLQIYDGGADGDADTPGDNTLFAVQGLFAP
jgi:ectonucleotide pyrophosphatase/phosphodiesterase family member 5